MNYLKYIRITCFLFSFFSLAPVWAQVDDWSMTGNDEYETPRSFEDYLVQLALENLPKSKIMDTKIDIAKENVKAEKREWLNAFNANIGFNSIKDTFQVLGSQYLAPGYNYGLSLSLGQLINTGPHVNMAKQKQKIEELEKEQYKSAVKKEVLQLYQKYLLAIEVLKTRLQSEEEASATYQLMNALFKKNRADFDEKNQAHITYYDTMEKRLSAETEVKLLKIALEEWLGQKWETVEKRKSSFRN